MRRLHEKRGRHPRQKLNTRLLRLEQQDGAVTQVEVNEVFCL